MGPPSNRTYHALTKNVWKGLIIHGLSISSASCKSGSSNSVLVVESSAKVRETFTSSASTLFARHHAGICFLLIQIACSGYGSDKRSGLLNFFRNMLRVDILKVKRRHPGVCTEHGFTLLSAAARYPPATRQRPGLLYKRSSDPHQRNGAFAPSVNHPQEQ